MADGAITVAVTLDDKQAEKELLSLQRKIDQLKKELNAAQADNGQAAGRALRLQKASDAEYAKLDQMLANRSKYSAQEIADQKAITKETFGQFDAARKQADQYAETLRTAPEQIEKMEQQAGNLVKQINVANDNTKQTVKHVDVIGQRLKALAKRVFVTAVILKGLRVVRDYIGKIMRNNEEFRGQIARLKGALLTAAQPLIDIILPAAQVLLQVLTDIVTRIGSALSLLNGKTLVQNAKKAAAIYEETANKSMAAFDEIQTLSDSNGSDASFKLAEEDGVSSFKSEISDIADIVIAIGEGILAWKIASAFTQGVETIKNLFTSAEKSVHSIAAGVGISVVGVTLSWQGGSELGAGSTSAKSIVKTILGIAATALGGQLIASAAAGAAAGPYGLAIGLAVGVLVSLVSASIAADQKAVKDLHDALMASSAGREIEAIRQQAEALLETSATLKIRINGISTAVDSETMGKIGVAQSLIDDIFSLDAEDNKTAEQIQVLIAKIEALNGMKLDGIQLEYNALTGKVEGTKDAVQGVIDALIQQARVAAAYDALVAAYKAEYEAQLVAEKAADVRAEANERYIKAIKERERIMKLYNDPYVPNVGANGEAEYDFRKVTASEWKEIQDAMKLADAEFTAAASAYATATDAWQEANDNLVLSQEKVAEIENAYTGLLSIATDSSKGIAEAITDAKGEAESAASQMGEGIQKALADAIEENEALPIRAFKKTLSGFTALGGASGILGGAFGIKVPALASGAVIPPNREFMAVLGDQTSGNNIEAPEALLRQMAQEAAGANTQILRDILSAVRAGKVMAVDRQVFARLTYDMNKEQSTVRGASLVTVSG